MKRQDNKRQTKWLPEQPIDRLIDNEFSNRKTSEIVSWQITTEESKAHYFFEVARKSKQQPTQQKKQESDRLIGVIWSSE